jgi:hypothetical protein
MAAKPCGGGQSVGMHGSKLQARAGRKERQGAKGTFGQKYEEYDENIENGVEDSDLGRGCSYKKYKRYRAERKEKSRKGRQDDCH